MSNASINSQTYWNDRFDQDWESNLGREQSRFFAKVAVDNMPEWLKSLARAEGWSICDWGCAQGDGTEVLADYLAPATMTGVDFAEAAIEKARATYGRLRFETQDWVADPAVAEQFDAVFSSNTLEHFSDPFSVLAQLFRRATRCVILALPYRELIRVSEHFYTFTGENIPLIPDPEWSLVHGAAVDCRAMEPTYWQGEQVLLVYGRRDWVAEVGLALGDAYMQADTPVQSTAMADLTARIAELSEKLEQYCARNDSLQAHNEALQARNEELHEREKALQVETQALQSSLSWRMTKPLRALARLLGK